MTGFTVQCQRCGNVWTVRGPDIKPCRECAAEPDQLRVSAGPQARAVVPGDYPVLPGMLHPFDSRQGNPL